MYVCTEVDTHWLSLFKRSKMQKDMYTIFIQVSMYTLLLSKDQFRLLGLTGSAPGLTVFDSGSCSRITHTALANFLYRPRKNNGVSLEIILRPDVPDLTCRASCSVFTIAFSLRFYVHRLTSRWDLAGRSKASRCAIVQ